MTSSPAQNKFKAFFRPRSRSRSRSAVPSPSPPAPMQSGHPPRDNPSGYKSSHRPVSTTTTATHSTITPLPSDAWRNRLDRGRHVYTYRPQSTDTHTSAKDHDQCSNSCEYDSDDPHSPRSETPSSSTRKSPFHSFFGISLSLRSSSSVSTPHRSASASDRNGSTSTSSSAPKTNTSRKRSFRLTSRPSTPKSVDEPASKSPYPIPVPSSPLPLSASPRRRSFGLAGSQRSTPKSSAGHLPLPHVQIPQAARLHGRRYSLGSERPPHDSAVALPEEPSHRSVHKGSLLPDGGGRNKGKEREHLYADSQRPLPDLPSSVNFASQSLPVDPSPISRNLLPPQFVGHPAIPQLSTVDSSDDEQRSLLAPLRLPVIPRIIHTPPTPQRPGEADSPAMPSSALPGVGSRLIPKGKAVTIAHKEQIIVSSSQSHSGVRRPSSSKGRFTPRFLSGKDSPKAKDSIGQKSNKRSTDGPSDAPAHKTPVPNTASHARSMTSHRGKLGSFDFERPVSALDRSSSTVDRQGIPVCKDNAPLTKPSLHSLERTVSNDSARIIYHPRHPESPAPSQPKPDHSGDASILSFSSVSLQTKSTGKGTGSSTPAGRSSSWGRVSGRHALRTSHGTFGFEHPSSVPNSPSPQTFHLQIGPNQDDLPTSPLNNGFGARGKHSRGQSTLDHVDPGCSKPGGRTSKGKGRSLDLGLGLSWAPSRLREEVLMPGSILSREKAKQEKIKAIGTDVTKVFESLLSESRFQSFKKYVHRFDAHVIPLEGPTGLLTRVEKLLVDSGLGEGERNRLMSEFTIFVQNHGG